MRRFVLTLVSIVGASLFMLPGGGCGGGTSGGNPTVALSFGSFDSNASWFNLITPAYASVSGLKLCFKRLRFKTADDVSSGSATGSSGNVDLSVGEVTLTAAGTSIASVTIPAGTYKRIEFDLSSDCALGKSIQVSNDSGAFNTNESITIKFEGTFVASDAQQSLTLGSQALVSALNAVTANDQIKSKAEGAGGTF